MPPLRGEEWLCDMSPSSSGWLASANKPLSFPSAPTSRVLAFVAAGSQTCVFGYNMRPTLKLLKCSLPLVSVHICPLAVIKSLGVTVLSVAML